MFVNKLNLVELVENRVRGNCFYVSESRPGDIYIGGLTIHATSTEIQSGIESLLTRLQSLNQRLQLVNQKRRGLDPAIGREILGQAVGAIAEGLFESSGVGDLGYSL